jgi:ATP-dependent protease ClpP protease subunit
VLVRGTIDRDAATRLTAQLLALDAASARPVRLQFDAPAADITAALLLADTLELLRVTSHGVVIREVGGGALAILAATTHRSALRHARLRLSEPRPDADLRHYADESEAAQQHAKLLAEFVDRLAQTTHRSTDEIAADLRGRRYLTATAAIEYRLIHEIAHPESTD